MLDCVLKDSLSQMMKKKKSKHFVCFIFKTSQTLKVKIQYKTKNFQKIAEINNETVKKKKKKKNTTAQLHRKSCEKADICSIKARSCSLGFFRFGRDPNLCSKSET